MRLFEPPMRFWTFATIIAGASGFGVFWWIWGETGQNPQLKIEVLKIVLQFLLVTVAGGVLLIFLNARRDEDQKDVARDEAVREMVEQIGTANRKLKMVKRRLRSQMASQNPGPSHNRALPYKIPAEAFEKAMEDLLVAQIESEHVRDKILVRSDILSSSRINRVYAALNYAARYFHDVYQDFEDCTVLRQEDCYEITATCAGLADFLSRRSWKQEPRPAWADAMEEEFSVLRDDRFTPVDRHQALIAIEKLRQAHKDMPRYRLIATESIALASVDIQGALRRRQWRSLLARGMTWLE